MTTPSEKSKMPAPSFSVLVQILATQAMAAMGAIKIPGQPDLKPEFPAAKQMIDLMSILEEKTKGNLTSDEARMFEAILTELRLAYVQLSSKK